MYSILNLIGFFYVYHEILYESAHLAKRPIM